MLIERQPSLFYAMVFVSFVFACLISVAPFSAEFKFLRPDFIFLFAVYWLLCVPRHLGLGFMFSIGLMQDLIEYTVWGAHALGLVIVAYICISVHRRFIRYPIWQQTLWMMLILVVHHIAVGWIQAISGHPPTMLGGAASVVVTALCWPVLCVAMKTIRRRLGLL